MVDIARDPRWGRIIESNGEDPYLGSVMARAWVKGYQQDDLSKPDSVAVSVKHFAAYGAAIAGRDYNAVDMSEICCGRSTWSLIAPRSRPARPR
jgi:beta-glucosidase